MPALPSRRLALAAILVAAGLALAAVLIVSQTSRNPAASASDSEPEPEPEPQPEGVVSAPPATPAPGTAPPALPSASEPLLAAEIRSLVASGQIGKARSRASAYFERFPDGPAEAELERLTGAHPRRDATDPRP